MNKLADINPLARATADGAKPRGDEVRPTLIANPYANTPNAAEYENGYQYAQTLGHEALNSADGSRWANAPGAWKQGLEAGAKSLGCGQLKAAAGYKALLRDSTKAFNQFTSQSETAPLRTTVSPVREAAFAARHANTKTPGLLDKLVLKAAPAGPHATPALSHGDRVAGVELRDPSNVIRTHGGDVARNFDPLNIIGHELTHGVQFANPRVAAHEHPFMSHGPHSHDSLAYDERVQPGYLRKQFGKSLNSLKLPPLHLPNLSPTAPSPDLFGGLAHVGVSKGLSETGADLGGDAFRAHLEARNPALAENLRKRWVYETAKAQARTTPSPEVPAPKPGRFQRPITPGTERDQLLAPADARRKENGPAAPLPGAAAPVKSASGNPPMNKFASVATDHLKKIAEMNPWVRRAAMVGGLGLAGAGAAGAYDHFQAPMQGPAFGTDYDAVQNSLGVAAPNGVNTGLVIEPTDAEVQNDAVGRMLQSASPSGANPGLAR